MFLLLFMLDVLLGLFIVVGLGGDGGGGEEENYDFFDGGLDDMGVNVGVLVEEWEEEEDGKEVVVYEECEILLGMMLGSGSFEMMDLGLLERGEYYI